MAKKILSFLIFLSTLTLLSMSVHAGSILVSESHYLGYGYGDSNWVNFSNTLDSDAGKTGDSVVTTANFENLGEMLSYDAIMLQAGAPGSTPSSLELQNITAFIATGRKVLMFGENAGWSDWNSAILGLVGGTFAGAYTGDATPIVSNSLTLGFSTSVSLADSGTANGGTPLFDTNFATLWGDNVLTILDVNIFQDSSWANNHEQFGTNVSNWLADSSSSPVPIPAAVWLFGSGLLGLFGISRRKKAAC